MLGYIPYAVGRALNAVASGEFVGVFPAVETEPFKNAEGGALGQNGEVELAGFGDHAVRKVGLVHGD
jgi:hypothetical protein